MGTHVVQAPSGLTIELRTFKVKDQDLLGDKRSQREGNAGSKLLEILTTKVLEAGPYKVASSDNMSWREWQKVLQGDRMAVLLRNRDQTNPDLPYVHRTPCKNPRCTEIVTVEFELGSFEVKPLPEFSLDHVRDPASHPLSMVLPIAGKRVSYRLLRGEDDKGLKSIKQDHGDQLSTKSLRFRTTDIEGVPPKDWENWLSDLDTPDQAYMAHEFEAADCGVEQEKEIGCPACGFTWKEDVVFDEDFLFPKYRAPK